jgi:general secretion pathway protein G
MTKIKLKYHDLKLKIKRAGQRGFTLLELLITLTILAILATAALPVAEVKIIREKESELKYALKQIRQGIDDYKNDPAFAVYPESLQQLVDNHKLRRIYEEPWGATWEYRTSTGPIGEWKELTGTSQEADSGDDIYDVRTSSTKEGLNGSQYNTF